MTASTPRESDLRRARERMIESQLVARGLRDPVVLAAMERVPREEFVPFRHRDRAYADCPLPIGCEQTISQPYVVGLMVAHLALRPGDRVLEVGTGSGYAAAVMSLIAREVHTVERHGQLALEASERLQSLGYRNVTVYHGDGSRGLPLLAPFEAVLVSAAGLAIPEALRGQLAVGGRMVMPVGGTTSQQLLRLVRATETRFREEGLGAVRFVPLIGGEADACAPSPIQLDSPVDLT